MRLGKTKHYRALTAIGQGVLMVVFLLLSTAAQAQNTASVVTLDLAVLSSDVDLAAFTLVRDGAAQQGLSVEQALTMPGWQQGSGAQELLAAPREFSTLWLQLGLQNTGSEPLARWLDISPWRLNQVDAWFLDPETQQVLARAQTGLDVPVAERSVESSRALLPVTLAPGEAQQLVIRIASESRPFLTINSWDPIDYTTHKVTRYQTHAILLAVILTLFAVLLLQGNRQYLLIGLWMLVTFIFESEKEGYISFVLFSSLADYAANIRFTAWVLSGAMFLVASVHLLKLNHHRWWRWLTLVVLSVAAISSILSFVLNGVDARNLGSAINAIFLCAWIALISSAIKQKQRYRWVFLFLLSLWWAVTAFILLGYIFNFYYTSAFATSRVVVEAGVTLGLLLVYSLQERADKRMLEYQLRAQEKQQRERLEQAVEMRTRELQQAVAEASQANAAKTDFLARITHDLRSPLTSVLGYSQLLFNETGRVSDMSRAIHSSASHMLHLVNRLLDYARGAGEGEVRLGDFYLFSFLDSIADKAHMIAQGNGNNFQLITAPGLPPMVRSDSTYLRQILLNLLDNAARHTLDGEVELHVSCAEQTHGLGVNLMFCIIDNGCGVPPEQQERLWEAFYQAPGQHTGLGLGLSIVQQLTQQLGGSLTFDSAVDKGTRVCVTLPMALGHEEDIDTAVMRLPRHILPSIDASGLTAWVVEDSPSIREFLSVELGGLGFSLCCFNDGQAAIEALSNSPAAPPDVVLTDYFLPAADGDAVLAAVKRRWPEVPVILLSATQKMLTLQPGTNGYAARLTKPVDLVILRRELAKACQRELVAPASSPRPTAEPGLDATAVEVTLDSVERQQLEQLLNLGAVTDLMEWCQQMAEATPEREALATRLYRLAEHGRFNAIAQLIGSGPP